MNLHDRVMALSSATGLVVKHSFAAEVGKWSAQAGDYSTNGFDTPEEAIENLIVVIERTMQKELNGLIAETSKVQVTLQKVQAL